MMLGILRCSRYAFGPNRLHYCGPESSAELKERINKDGNDWGLEQILRQFKTLYPYLKLIARANQIADPFDSQVVEAYWLGNKLLEQVSRKYFYDFLIEDFAFKKRALPLEQRSLERKIAQGAVPHHSFHVLNIWRQANKEKESQLLESLSECIVNFGVITLVDGPRIVVETQSLILKNGKFQFGKPYQKVLHRLLESEYDIEQIKVGQTISYHWGVPCEVINLRQLAALKKYNLQSVAFINQTI